MRVDNGQSGRGLKVKSFRDDLNLTHRFNGGLRGASRSFTSPEGTAEMCILHSQVSTLDGPRPHALAACTKLRRCSLHEEEIILDSGSLRDFWAKCNKEMQLGGGMD